MRQKNVLFTISLLLIISWSSLFSQNVGISETQIEPHESSILEIRSADKGVLLPRVSLTGINDNTTISNPANSLLIFNIATAGSPPNDVTPGYYYWDASGSKWIRFGSGDADGEAWLIEGNTGTSPASNFIGTIDNEALVFRTNNLERMRLGENGNLGIGTTTTTAGKLNIIHSDYTSGIWISNPGHGIEISGMGGGYDAIRAEGNRYGIYASGTLFGGIFYRNTAANNDDPSSVAEFVRKTSSSSMGDNMGSGILLSLEYGSGPTKENLAAIYAIRNGANDQGRLAFSTRSGGSWPQERMTVLHNGNVGVGHDNPWAKFLVRNGRIVVQNEAGYEGSGTSYYKDNPWIYLWTRETELAEDQGGNIIFAAMQSSTVAADLCMIEGVRENDEVNSTASRLAFSTRPATGNMQRRLIIDSEGHYTIRPENTSGQRIFINDDGMGTNSEPTIRTSANFYGFLGTDTNAWWRGYAHTFVNSSSRQWKKNIVSLDTNTRNDLYESFKSLDVVSYNTIREPRDTMDNIIGREIMPETIGLISEDAPKIIVDESGNGIKLYEYITLLTVALQESIERIEKLEAIIENYEPNNEVINSNREEKPKRRFFRRD